MPTAVPPTPDRGFSRLSRALSKLSLRNEDRKEQVKSAKASTPDAQNGPWSIPIPPGISKGRAREYMRSISLTPNGRLFLPQYSEIIPNLLFISDQYTGTDTEVLSQLRITHVVSIVNDSTKICRPLGGIRYYDMAIPNDVYKAHRLLAQIDDAVDFIDGALRNDEARVLIYCSTGVDWSPSVAIAWLMRNQSYTYKAGKEVVKRKREVVNPSLEIENSVQEWWALEVARPLFPLGRGGRSHGHAEVGESIKAQGEGEESAPRYTVELGILDDDSLGEVIDIR